MKIQSAAPFKTPKWVCRYSNEYKQTFYFKSSGEIYRGQTLISETVEDIKRARRFDTAPEALALLVEAKALVNSIDDGALGWFVMPVEK